jgi:prophage regulatory protein
MIPAAADVPPRQLVRVQAIADLIGISGQTLRAWAKDPSSTFPKPVRLGPKSLRYDLAEVEAWLDARRKAVSA